MTNNILKWGVSVLGGLVFGSEIYLGIDYSTGEVREDLPEYYEEIEEETEY